MDGANIKVLDLLDRFNNGKKKLSVLSREGARYRMLTVYQGENFHP